MYVHDICVCVCGGACACGMVCVCRLEADFMDSVLCFHLMWILVIKLGLLDCFASIFTQKSSLQPLGISSVLFHVLIHYLILSQVTNLSVC